MFDKRSSALDLATPTAAESLARISELIERLSAAVASDRNRARGKQWPTAVFALEDPIASSQIHGYDINRFYSDPFFYVEQTLRQKLWRWENFPDDDAALTLDLPASLSYYPEYTFVGMGLEFTHDGVPLIQTDHPMTRSADLRLLEPVDFATSGWMPRVLRWWDDINAIVAGRLKVVNQMIWWRGCLDLAIQLRGYDQFILDTTERPEFVHGLLRFLVEQRCRWWDAYYRYFGLPVQPTSIGDDWINVPFISPRLFAEFVLPRYLELEQFHGGVASVHSCGNQAPVQRYLLQIKSLPGLEVTAWTDLTQSLVNIPPDKRLAIALHPNDVLFATREQMAAKLEFITTSCTGRRYGIGTSGLTPILGSTAAFVEQIRMWQAVAKEVLDPIRQPA
ncbi:MAG: hypothetical protein FJ011_21900 [Chloroflexi bacterium]|nr:hypothetical protein [Chloroflexota bacterium]